MFLIDPVLRVIEKKRYRYRDFDGFEVGSVCEILAMRDRVLFICVDRTTGPTTLVSEPGPDLLTRRFTLGLINPRVWVRYTIYLHRVTSTYI